MPLVPFLVRAVVRRRAACHVVSIVLALFACTTLAYADVPGRVGRIAYLEGDVQAYSEADPQWKVAYANQPLTSRNSLFVGDTGRAEVSIGSTTLAMDAGSQVDIQQLDDSTFNANVVRGHVSMRIRRMDAGDLYNVATPDASFALLQPGRYRIDSLADSSGITVFAGQASAQGQRSSTLVNAGSALRVAGDPSNPDAPSEFLAAPFASLAIDNWVADREARFRDSQAERYVSPNMTGYEDLDANGRWSSEPDVGPVWYPTNVQQDWAPYRYGRWAYVAPWGYTWIDDAPWGFAPFHYGRWIEVGNRWGWVPGAYVARPVYAPALVGFYGSGLSASFAFGAGPAVGWYPLAPWQRYAAALHAERGVHQPHQQQHNRQRAAALRWHERGTRLESRPWRDDRTAGRLREPALDLACRDRGPARVPRSRIGSEHRGPAAARGGPGCDPSRTDGRRRRGAARVPLTARRESRRTGRAGPRAFVAGRATLDRPRTIEPAAAGRFGSRSCRSSVRCDRRAASAGIVGPGGRSGLPARACRAEPAGTEPAELRT